MTRNRRLTMHALGVLATVFTFAALAVDQLTVSLPLVVAALAAMSGSFWLQAHPGQDQPSPAPKRGPISRQRSIGGGGR